MIPVNTPLITQDAKDLVAKALAEGWISSAGPYIERFEKEFAHYLGVKHAISVNTGTAALHVALLAAGIGEGDEVIVPAFTMAASWMAVMYGITPHINAFFDWSHVTDVGWWLAEKLGTGADQIASSLGGAVADVADAAASGVASSAFMPSYAF